MIVQNGVENEQGSSRTKGAGRGRLKGKQGSRKKTETKSLIKLQKAWISSWGPRKSCNQALHSYYSCNGCTDHLQPHRYLLGRRPWCGCPGCRRFCIPFFCNPDGSYRRAWSRWRCCNFPQDRGQG